MNMAWSRPGRRPGAEAQAAAELGWQMTGIAELIGSGREITMDAVPMTKLRLAGGRRRTLSTRCSRSSSTTRGYGSCMKTWNCRLCQC